MNLLILLLLSLLIISNTYITSFNLLIKKNNNKLIGNFMNLNKIINSNDYSNKLKIEKQNKYICYKYITYSDNDDYIYDNIYLIKNKNNTIITRFSFDIFNITYTYLCLINFKNISINRTLINVYVKYNTLILNNKTLNDKIIYKYILKCFIKNDKEFI